MSLPSWPHISNLDPRVRGKSAGILSALFYSALPLAINMATY